MSFRYGTFGCGLNLLPMAWPIAELVFEVDVSLRLRNGVFPGRAPTPSISDSICVLGLYSVWSVDRQAGVALVELEVYK